MKRFVAAAVLLLAMGIGGYWAVFYSGFYLRFGERPAVDVPFRAEGTELQRWNGQEYVPFLLRGVDVSASLPGHYKSFSVNSIIQLRLMYFLIKSRKFFFIEKILLYPLSYRLSVLWKNIC